MTHDIADHSPAQQAEASSGRRLNQRSGRSPLKRLTVAATAGALVVTGLGAVTATVAQAVPVNTVLSTISLVGVRVVAITPDGRFAYVTASSTPGVVSVVDIDSTSANYNTVIGSPITVGAGAYGIAINSSGTRAYVANYNDGSVSVINTSNNTVIDTDPSVEGITPITVGTAPIGVAFNPLGTRAYVVNSGSNSVSVIDTSNNTVIDTDPSVEGITPITVGNAPQKLVINPLGTRAYVTNVGSNSVSVIDTSSNTVIGSPITVGTEAFGIAINPAGSRVYVTNIGGGTVSVIDTSNNTLIDAVPGTVGVIDPITVGDAPTSLAFNPSGTRAYVTLSSSTGPVVMLDTDSTSDTYNTVIGSPIVLSTLGGGSTSIAITPDGSRAYVTNFWDASMSVIYLGAPPGAPTGVSAVAGTASATVSWTAPSIAGDSAITGYTVTSSPGGLTCTSANAAARSCVVSGLTNGTAYTFTVKAASSVGTSVASSASSAVTPAVPVVEAPVVQAPVVVAPVVIPTPTPTPTPTASVVPAVVPTVTPTVAPSASALPVVSPPAGVVMLTAAEIAKATPVVVSAPLSTSVLNAPEVTVTAGAAVAPVVSGLPVNTPLEAGMSMSPLSRAKETFIAIGKTRSTASGQAKVPAFKASRPGTYTIRLATPTGKAFYLKVKVAAKKTSSASSKLGASTSKSMSSSVHK